MILIDVKAAASVGLVAYQNARRFLESVTLFNDASDAVTDLTVSVTASPAFICPVQWNVDRVEGNGMLPLRGLEAHMRRDPEFDGREGERGEVVFVVRRDGEEVASRVVSVRILADTEWGGSVDMPELLASFSIPSDPAVERLMREASRRLQASGQGRLDGYESKDSRRVWHMVQSVWAALVAEGIEYAPPPASWERGQRVRFPSIIEQGGVGTCLDTTMLFASVIEQCGLDPVVVVTKDHALPGAWLRRQDGGTTLEREAGAVRKAIAAGDLVIFESTLATGSHPATFGEAIEAGARIVRVEDESAFTWMLDVSRARIQGIRPLKSVGDGTVKVPGGPGEVAWDAAPELPVQVDIVDRTVVSGRIDRWQRKLLDLSARNRLLNVPQSSAKYLGILSSDPGRVEDLLASGAKLRLGAMPDMTAGGRDVSLFEERERVDLHGELAKASLDRKELLVRIQGDRFDAALTSLYRQAKSDLREGGSNTLFLGIGALVWRKQDGKATKSYRAPLIMVPVTIERKSASSPFELVAHQDETRFNLTLAEMLRHDFDLYLPGLENDMPRDKSGIDVAVVQQIVRQAVRTTPGFEVVDDLTLGIFSFAKFLMWKDLVDREDDLRRSEVVRGLVDRTVAASHAGGDSFGPHEIDSSVRPIDVYTPLPADSSQLAAVIASARGESFVMIGPPGSGKSQTIANMIAHNMALGRRVLFVAEKMAALEVVHRRLTEKGLGQFCLEVHSHKASKTEVINQLDRAWSSASSFQEGDWNALGSDLTSERDRLNAYVHALHREHPNGMSIHQAVGIAVRHDAKALNLKWKPGRIVDADALASARRAARKLGIAWKGVQDLGEGFQSIWNGDWSNAWQERIVTAAGEGVAATRRLDRAEAEMREALGGSSVQMTPSDGARLAKAVGLASDVNIELALHEDCATVSDVGDQIAKALDLIAAPRMSLSVDYDLDRVPGLDLPTIHQDWSRALGGFWIWGRKAREKVARDLAFAGGAMGSPDVEADLHLLRQIQQHMKRISGLVAGCSHMALIRSWTDYESDPAAIRAEVAGARAVREAVGGSKVVSSALRRALSDAEGHAAQDVARIARRLVEASAAYDAAVREYEAAADIDFDEGMDRSALMDEFALVVGAANKLRDWCAWRAAEADAERNGLERLTAAVREGIVAPEETQLVFEASHARWFAANAMDGEPILLESSRMHEEAGARFRVLDQSMQEMTSALIGKALSMDLPRKDSVAKSSGFGALKREVAKKRAHKPVRELISEMGDSFRQLAPCMLMSPISVAQHLPPDASAFDLVIFDEASQITSWDAVGAMARGSQVIVAGDPKQMPPTNYFSKGSADEEDEEEGDLESILEECLMSGMRERRLDWHYRSRHENLIAFSNQRYYRNGLVTFPAPTADDTSVQFRNVNGTYVTGKRINLEEARWIADEVAARLRDPVFVASGRTIGVITMNTDQQTLIENLLDERRKQTPAIERFWNDDLPEPVVVHNLESAQGDERDVVFLSFGFGPTIAGGATMSMSMGALNKSGAQRRLNVAISRARAEMVVVTSFDPSMIDLGRTKAEAIRDLKDFLTFAKVGPSALEAFDRGSLGGVESPFEEAVADELQRRGWTIRTQVGVSRFRIDFGIVHPDRPGDFLAGVEADGASYHSAHTARDRDKVRASILKGLGWKLVRVWSTDWWADRRGASDELHRALVDLLDADRRAPPPPPLPPIASHPEDSSAPEVSVDGTGRASAATPKKRGRPRRIVEEPALPMQTAAIASIDLSASDEMAIHETAMSRIDSVRSRTPEDVNARGSVSGDEDVVVQSDRLEMVSGRFCAMEYVDAAGERTVRDVVCHRLKEQEGDARLEAFCLLRRAPRHFLVSRIGEVVDRNTGEAYRSGIDFAAAHAMSDVDGPKSSWGLRRLEFVGLKAALIILAAVARADDVYADAEKAVMREFLDRFHVASGVVGFNIDMAMKDSSRILPSPSLLKDAVKLLNKTDTTARSMVAEFAMKMMDADGRRDASEMEIVRIVSKL